MNFPHLEGEVEVEPAQIIVTNLVEWSVPFVTSQDDKFQKREDYFWEDRWLAGVGHLLQLSFGKVIVGLTFFL